MNKPDHAVSITGGKVDIKVEGRDPIGISTNSAVSDKKYDVLIGGSSDVVIEVTRVGESVEGNGIQVRSGAEIYVNTSKQLAIQTTGENLKALSTAPQITAVDYTVTPTGATWESKAITWQHKDDTDTYTVTVENDGNGTGSASPDSAEAGDEITLSATPNDGYVFKEWEVISGSVTVSGNKFTMPAGDVTVKAIFEETSSTTYTVTINGGGSGASGEGDYEAGDSVTIKAGNRSNYTFEGWTSSDGTTITNASNKTASFTMPAHDVTVTANWSYSGGGGSSSGGKDKDTDTSKTETPEIKEEKPPVKPAPNFKDINAADWFYKSVLWAYENNLMNGTGDDSFSPYSDTTRGMIVTILHRLEGTQKATTDSNFTDVEANKYYADAVAWAYENKIVNGYGNGIFAPDNAITREQLALILMNYAQYKGYEISAKADLSKFADGESVSPWAKEAMSWANAVELIRGSQNQLMPTGNAQRSQVAAILQRFLETIAK